MSLVKPRGGVLEEACCCCHLGPSQRMYQASEFQDRKARGSRFMTGLQLHPRTHGPYIQPSKLFKDHHRFKPKEASNLNPKLRTVLRVLKPSPLIGHVRQLRHASQDRKNMSSEGYGHVSHGTALRAV